MEEMLHEDEEDATAVAVGPVPLCPICGSGDYVAGPKGRMSPEGLPPRCAACGALERHRNYRMLFEALRPILAGRRALQFSDDSSAPRDAFASFHPLPLLDDASSSSEELFRPRLSSASG